MKRKFFFHRQNQPLEADHVVYVLWVGESVREQKLLAQMMSWSFAHAATLRSWTEDVDFYLQHEADRVFPSRGLIDFGFVTAHIGAQELLILMEDDSFDAYERVLTTPKAYFYQMATLDPICVDRSSGSIDRSMSLSRPRKNLSQRDGAKPRIISFI